MKSFLEFSRQLDEKQIQYGKNANYGQVVFFAGGAGSGKGFAISNFIDKSKFKIFDVDELKMKLTKLPSMVKKYPDIPTLKLSNPADVSRLHAIAAAEKIPEKQLSMWIGNFHDPSTLPNLLFDMTFKRLEAATDMLPDLLKAGYKPENIHITWVLTNFKVAIQNNRARTRRVSDLVMLQTHTGAALTMSKLLSGGLPKEFNGSFTIILNNPEETVYYDRVVPQYKQNQKLSPSLTKEIEKDAHGNPIYIKTIKDFTYLKVKETGRGMPSLEEIDVQIREKIYSWVMQNAPKMKEIESAYGNR
jgi:hypothetical protein